MKHEMNCYKCNKNHMIEIPSVYPGYYYCPVCEYPMTFVGDRYNE